MGTVDNGAWLLSGHTTDRKGVSLSLSYTHNKYASALLFYVVENAYKERGRPQKAQTEGRAKRGEFQEYVELQVFKDCRGL